MSTSCCLTLAKRPRFSRIRMRAGFIAFCSNSSAQKAIARRSARARRFTLQGSSSSAKSTGAEVTFRRMICAFISEWAPPYKWNPWRFAGRTARSNRFVRLLLTVFIRSWKGRESAIPRPCRRPWVERRTVPTKHRRGSPMIYRDHTRRLVLDHAYIVSVPLSQSARFLGRCSKTTILFIFSVLLVLPAGSADDPGTLLKHNFESAKSALAAGNEIEAERHYNRTVALGLRPLANLSISESRFDEATRELDQALKSAPGDPDIGVDAAVAWFRAGEIQKARQLAQSVVAANPRHARAQTVLRRIYPYRADFDAAIRDLQTSVAIDEDFETSYFLGIAYLKAKLLPYPHQCFRHFQSTI